MKIPNLNIPKTEARECGVSLIIDLKIWRLTRYNSLGSGRAGFRWKDRMAERWSDNKYDRFRMSNLRVTESHVSR